MRIKKSIPLLLIPVSLLVCAFADNEKNIVFFGDSITAGYGINKTQAYPSVVQELINSKNYNYNVVNAGLSGETSAGGLSRINWVLKNEVDIFVLELGANDALRGLPLDQTQKNLQSIIDKVKQKYPQAKIVIAGMMVPPNLGNDYTNNFQKIFPALAAKNNATLIPFLLEGVAGDKSLNQADGIHPNTQGHKIVASNVWKILEGVIK